jgi:hypothetical protein
MGENDRNNGSSTVQRNADGTFGTGNSGRQKGARHKVTRAVEVLLEGQSEAIAQKAIDKALAGDTVALRLCLERIAPAHKDSPVQFDLPPIKDASEAAQAASAVLEAVSEGNLTPLEAASVMGLLDSFRRALELSEYDGRLEALERATSAHAK